MTTHRAVAAIAAVALVAVACGGGGEPPLDPVDATSTDDAVQDTAPDDDPVAADDASVDSSYVHPVPTDLALPDDRCELVRFVDGQRLNGGTTIAGKLGLYLHEGELDLAAIPYGLLHLANIVDGIEALDDPELDPALQAISELHDDLSAVMDDGQEGTELADALLAVWYSDDDLVEAGFVTFARAWETWLRGLDVDTCD